MKTYKKIILVQLLLAFFNVVLAENSAENAKKYAFTGYVKNLSGLRVEHDFSDAVYDNLLHNRLNFTWRFSDNFNVHAAMRNRVLYNPVLSSYPILKTMFESDDGFFDLSCMWLDSGDWIAHSSFDRLYLDFNYNKWHIRAGRQRINWGMNVISNPNDLFNTYSFFDFDYQERPGSDALRVQYHTGFASRIEMAYSPADDIKESAGAMLVSKNYKAYDLQFLAGYYKNRLAIGTGWAGNIRSTGFKGEGTWFYDVEEKPHKQRGNFVAAAGIDYMFNTGTFVVLELLYNGGHKRSEHEHFMITQPLRPDNIMFSEFAVTINALHHFSSLFQGGLALMTLPDIEAAFIMPNINFSAATNLDVEFITQIFAGGDKSIFQDAGYYCVLSLNYAF